jgi:hypothetical protein
MAPGDEMTTHEVTNQPPPLAGVNLWTRDPTFVAAARREGGEAAQSAEPELAAFGARLGSAEAQRLAEQANENPPSCAPTTAGATASTRSTSTPPGTPCCASPSRTAWPAAPGPGRAPAPTWCARRR